MASRRVPIACTLTVEGAATQLDEWADLGRRALLRSEPTTTGARVWFDAAYRAQVDDLARRESTCCAFLTIDVEDADDETVSLSIGSQDPDARPVIDALLASISRSAGTAPGSP